MKKDEGPFPLRLTKPHISDSIGVGFPNLLGAVLQFA